METIEFDSFKQMIEFFEDQGYRVKQVSGNAAVIFNDGVEEDYSMFDNFVATVARNNGFGFRPPNNMTFLYENTVRENRESEDFEIYLGVFKDEVNELLENTKYTFLEKEP